MTVRDFATFCPKAIAGLGRLPDTVQTRCSIPVAMKRRRADEPVSARVWSSAPRRRTPWRIYARSRPGAGGTGTPGKLGKATPARPNGLGDRAYDVWRPLLAIADAAGGTADEDWPARARAAAATLSGKGADRPTSYGVALLEEVARAVRLPLSAHERRRGGRAQRRRLNCRSVRGTTARASPRAIYRACSSPTGSGDGRC